MKSSYKRESLCIYFGRRKMIRRPCPPQAFTNTTTCSSTFIWTSRSSALQAFNGLCITHSELWQEYSSAAEETCLKGVGCKFPRDGRQAMQLVKLFSRYARGQNKVSISVCCQGRCQTSPSGLLPIGWCLARSCRGSTRDRAPMLVGKLHYKEDATNRLSSSLMMTNP